VVSLDNERRLSAGLRQAMKERDTLQLAKGVVMQRDAVSEEAAFRWLVTEARVSQRSLQDLAASIVGTMSRPSD
jgi:AmiR/NasT family two-component response regulator